MGYFPVYKGYDIDSPSKKRVGSLLNSEGKCSKAAPRVAISSTTAEAIFKLPQSAARAWERPGNLRIPVTITHSVPAPVA